MTGLKFTGLVILESKMAGDSSEDDLENWVFYRDRDEWRDVSPIEQDEGPFPVVAIAYTDKCKSAFFESVELYIWIVFLFGIKYLAQFPGSTSILTLQFFFLEKTETELNR